MDENLDTVKQFWTRNLNGLAFLPSFPKTADDFWSASALRYKYHYHLLPLFDKVSTAYPNGKLLEIGCGMGDDTAQWAKRGMRVSAIDLTEPAIECTKLRFATCQLEGEITKGNAEALDFRDNTFEIVYSFGVLHHTPDTQKAINEVWRVLKPGGLAVIMLYHRKSLNYCLHRLLHYPFDGTRKDACPVEHTYTKQQLFEMFRLFAGCEVSVEYLFGTGYGVMNALLPTAVHRFLGRLVGWHLMAEAIK